jgi:hypothetical protein
MAGETFKDNEEKKKNENLKYDNALDKEKAKNEIKNKLKKIIEQLGNLLQGESIDISRLLQDLDSLENLENLKDLKEKVEKILQKLDEQKLKIAEDLFKQLEDLFV